MENQKNNKIVIILLVVIIVILSVLCILFATGTINYNSNKENDNDVNKNINDNNNILDDNSDLDNNENTDTDIVFDYKLEAKTSVKVDLLWNNKYDTIEVINGNLKVNDETFSIKNDKIKYFYLQRYQSSASVVVHYLTEKGNIYVTEFTSEDTIDSFNNFIKLNYSNVTDIVVLPNDHYGKTYDDVSGIVDNREFYLYAVVNGKKLKLDYQYSY